MEHTRDHRWTWSENNVHSTRHYQKKTRNKETETQTYKLDAKEYGVFVGGGEGVFPPPPYTFGSGNKSWLFTFSLWIFGILEWLILNKKVFVGFLPEAPPFGKLFWTESDSTLRVTLVWGHFFGMFPFIFSLFLLKILFQLFTGGIAALLKVWAVTL